MTEILHVVNEAKDATREPTEAYRPVPGQGMTDGTKPPRKSGIAHFFAAAGYSLGGLRRLSGESAFRQEVALIAGLLVLFLIFGASLPEMLGLLALGLLLIAVEALNTALEVLVDHLSPGWSQFAKEAKDLGSLAVACTIGIVLIYAGVVLIW